MKVKFNSLGFRLILIGIMASGAMLVHARTRGNYRVIKASLPYETPAWKQTAMPSGHPCGCGATAWAIVMGYWKQHRGKSNLLEGITMPHTQRSNDIRLAAHMTEISKTMGSTYGVYRGDKWGRTTPGKMESIKKYIRKRGYNCTIKRIRGREFDKFRKVKKALDQNKPVIILINDPARAFSSLHYPVIEKAELKQKKVLGKWRDRDVRYWVNMGHGKSNYGWIWVREFGKNNHKHTGSFSMFIADIHD